MPLHAIDVTPSAAASPLLSKHRVPSARRCSSPQRICAADHGCRARWIVHFHPR